MDVVRNRVGPQMEKKAPFPLPPLGDLAATAGIPKFSLKIPAIASPLRKRGTTQTLQVGRHFLSF